MIFFRGILIKLLKCSRGLNLKSNLAEQLRNKSVAKQTDVEEKKRKENTNAFRIGGYMS